MPGYTTIVVLNDGETYTSVKGCSICVITDEQAEQLESGEIACKDLSPISEIGLDSLSA